MVEFREISLARPSDVYMLDRFYHECLVPAFPNQDELDSLDDIKECLRRKRDGEYDANNYHVVLTFDADNPIGGGIFDYLAEANAGVIEFLVVNADRRRIGLGTQLVEQSEVMIAADAQRAGQQLKWVAAELDDPFRTPSDTSGLDPFLRAAFWDRSGYRMLDFPYTQPALSTDKSPVDTLLMAAKTVAADLVSSVPTQQVIGLLHEYFRWAMHIDEPEADAAFQAMSAYLRGAGTAVPFITLRDYAGMNGDDVRIRIHDIAGPHDPRLQAAIDVYTSVFTDPAIAIPADEFREALKPGGIASKPGCHYHLWAIYRANTTVCEGMASFLSAPAAGFGGYLGLIPPLRGGGHLPYLVSRIEKQMIEDGTGARGWYVECAGRLERDIFLRPSIGFHELDVPYVQPSGSGTSTLAAGRPLHLLYKPFGRVYRPADVAVPDFLTSVEQILTTVYGIDDPQSSEAYVRLAQFVSGREIVPVVPKS